MDFEQHKNKGNEHFRSGKYEEAVREYQHCIDTDPTNAVGYSNLAMAHLKLSNFEQARDACEQGLRYCEPAAEKLRQKLQYRLNLAKNSTMDALVIKEVDAIPPHLAGL